MQPSHMHCAKKNRSSDEIVSIRTKIRHVVYFVNEVHYPNACVSPFNINSNKSKRIVYDPTFLSVIQFRIYYYYFRMNYYLKVMLLFLHWRLREMECIRHTSRLKWLIERSRIWIVRYWQWHIGAHRNDVVEENKLKLSTHTQAVAFISCGWHYYQSTYIYCLAANAIFAATKYNAHSPSFTNI